MAETKLKTSCFHCGDDCGLHPIWEDDKPFCCAGCKTVFEILNQNDLCEFYDLESTPGNKIDPAKESSYDFLDNEDIAQELLDFKDGSLSRITLFIPQIHCSSCIWLLENISRLNEGVRSCKVDFQRKKASILFDHETVSLKELVLLLVRIGYEPVITLDNAAKGKEKVKSTLPIKIGIAGFCFGNIMLMSFPEYVGGLVEMEFRQFFGYANLALSIPVVFYSGWHYMSSAGKALRYKSVNIDVPIALGVLALYSRSIYEILWMGGAGYLDSLAGLIFFLLIGKWYQDKTYKTLTHDRDFRSYFPLAATLVKDGTTISVPVRDVKEGDVIMIRNQEIIPADGILSKGDGHIDYSFVTGESDTTRKYKGDPLFAGGRQCGPSIEVVVTKPVDQSYLTQLWNQEAFDKDQSTPRFKTLIDLASKRFTLAVLIIAAITSLTWWMIDPSRMAFVVTSVLIVACPCALALAMPFSFGSAMRELGRQALYLRNANVIEPMSKIDSIVFDKTGTITSSSGSGTEYVGDPLSTEEVELIASTASHSMHPISMAIATHLDRNRKQPRSFEEVPGQGIEAHFEKDVVRIGSAAFVGTYSASREINATHSFVSVNGVAKGCFVMRKSVRRGLSDLLTSLKSNYKMYLLSGDNDAEKVQFSGMFGDESKLRFNQDPHDKLSFVKGLQDKERNVAMIGDGLNDAGALQQSDVGIAVSDNVYSFSPSCDAIVAGNSLEKLDMFLDYSKKVMGIVKASFVISILYNLTGMFFAVQGLLTPLVAAILMPLSSVTIIAFTTLAARYWGRRVFRR